MKAYIYKITNTINGKIYIGKHIDKNTDEIDDYMGSGIILIKAQKKYGIDKFKKEILEECLLTELDSKEVYWIQKLNATNHKIGYNITIGGEGGDTLSNNPDLFEIKKKMSKASMGRRGWKHTEQTKQKIREKALGRKMPPRIITLAERERKRHCAIKNPLFGRKHTPEEKIKMSIERSGKIYWNNGVINKRSKTCPGDGWVRGILVSPDSKKLRSITHKGKLSAFKGKHHSKSTKEKLSKSHKGIFDGANNPSAKTIEIISPNNEIWIVTGGLLKFCKEHSLSYTMAIKYRNLGPCPDSKFANGKFGKNTVGWIFNDKK